MDARFTHAAVAVSSLLALVRPRIANRVVLVASLLLGFAGPGSAEEQPAEPTLTERDAVARALGRASLSDTLAGALEVEEGRANALSALPNPELGYSREQTFGTAGSAEDYVILSQNFDVFGRRQLRAHGASARARAARLDGAATRLAVAMEARRRFFEVLYHQQRIAEMKQWVAHVGEALTVVSKREERGDVAAYDRRRLEREQVVAAGRLASEGAALQRARARLSALLGGASVALASGQVLPSADPAPLPSLRVSSAKRPDLLALDQLGNAAGDDLAAADRWFIPDLKLEAGWKGVALGGARADGYVAGIALALPLWDRSRGLARAAEGEARIARGRRFLLETELAGELEGARAAAVELRHVALGFREQAASHSSELVRMAVTGYGAGELSVLELLDAYRGAAEDGLNALEMELSARRSRLELDEMTGVPFP